AATRLLILAAFLGLWEAGADIGVIDPYFLPAPRNVALAVWDLIATGELARHLPTTAGEAAGGLAIGAVLATTLGILSGRLRRVGEIVEPFAVLGNAVPRIVLAPLFVFWLGIGPTSKVALSALMVFFVVYLAVFSGMRQAEARFVEHARLLGARPADIVREVYVPSVLGWLFASLRLALGFAFSGAVIGELLGSSRGLGYLVNAASGRFDPAGILAVVVVILTIIGIAFAGLALIERRALAWRAPDTALVG
nr:ABC transporter permease [Solirubrobacterales bacterium]